MSGAMDPTMNTPHAAGDVAAEDGQEPGSKAVPETHAVERPDADEVAAWLRLTLTPGVGRVLGRRLLVTFGLPQCVLGRTHRQLSALLPEPSVRALLAPPGPRMAALTDRTVAWLDEPGNRMLTLADADYPRGLLDLADPPLVLYVRGSASYLSRPGLAMVGARNASVQGTRDAEAFGEAFSRMGLTVVSGLALGIDAAAHAGGLCGAAGTVAVVGTGVDLVYPACHQALVGRIVGHGAIVSEFPLGAAGRSHHFPQRNRIIAALSRGVLVVEAARQSGSLITAHQAATLGREVFAIPGSIHAPMSKGCHQLIREGARLVECARDVLEELGLADGSDAEAPSRPSDQARDPVIPPTGPRQASRSRRESQLDLLQPDNPPERAAAVESDFPDPLGAALAFDPVTVDELCVTTGLPAQAVSAALLHLEMRGLAERLPGERYRRLGGSL